MAGTITDVTNSADTVAGDAPRRGLVIAVDGPAGSGKSSAARGAARRLGLRYLESGAMYRALTLWLLRTGVDVVDPAAVAAVLGHQGIVLGTDPVAPSVLLDDADVTARVRLRDVSNAVSSVARMPAVRAHLIVQQRAIIDAAVTSGPGIVAEGRDIGAVVAPDALVKVYLTASEQERAARRTAELAADPEVTPEQTAHELLRRDGRDSGQLARAADAVEIDTTGIALSEVVDRIVGLAERVRAVARG